MLSDLAALTPPLVICVAFLIGVAVLVRHQLAPKRPAVRPEDAAQAPEALEASEEPQPETRRGPADPAYPTKPDKPVRRAMSRDEGNGTSSAADPDRTS